MKIGTRHIDATQPPYIIAEIGVNHDGAVDRAVELVEAARRCGADAIKLQLFETDRLLSKAAKLAAYQKQAGEGDPFEMLRRLELTADQMKPIVAAAQKNGLHAIVTVFSIDLVAPAQALGWDAYKVASPDVINQPLIEMLMGTARPLLVSTGAASLDEVRQVTEWLGRHPHILFHCVSAYPAPEDSASLGAIGAMQIVNPNSLGYSDHTTAVDTGALAVAAGARVLEKHLTHDRKATGPDHAASLDPADFAEYVRLAHRAHRMLGESKKEILKFEQDVRSVSRQSLTAARLLKKGDTLTAKDVTIKRPGTGLAPHQLQAIIGQRVRRTIEADMPIMEGDLE